MIPEIEGLAAVDHDDVLMSKAERMVLDFAKSRMRAAQVVEDPVLGCDLAPARITPVWQLLWRQIKRNGLEDKVRLAVRAENLYLVRREP